LYFLLTDINGSILISDNEDFLGKSTFEVFSIKDVNSPVATSRSFEGNTGNKNTFSTFLSEMNQDLLHKNMLMAQKNDIIFDTFWDIEYMGEKIGSLRIGFSIKIIKENLSGHVIQILTTGFVILIFSMSMIFYIIRKSCSLWEN
jgi:hypothetical protein